MAIEPLGSVMTIQSQPTQQVKATYKEASDNTEVSGQTQESAVVDAKTLAVKKTEEKDSQGENAQEQQMQQPTSEQMRKAIEQMNKKMAHSEAIYGFHEDTNRVTIKIVDKDTKEVIKELPPEKTLDMIAKVWEMAGILVDERR